MSVLVRPIHLFCLFQTGGEQLCPVQIQPPAVEGASNHNGAGQDVPQPDQLLAAGDALPEAPEGSQRRCSWIQGQLHQVAALPGVLFACATPVHGHSV